jgi:hypothetical protein
MRIGYCFLNVHMGLSHEGLSKLARQKGLNPATLPAETVLVFINRSRDKLKILTPGGQVLGYLNQRGRRIELAALQYIPQAFGNKTGFDYDKALKLHLEKQLVRPQRPVVSLYGAQGLIPGLVKQPKPGVVEKRA